MPTKQPQKNPKVKIKKGKLIIAFILICLLIISEFVSSTSLMDSVYIKIIVNLIMNNRFSIVLSVILLYLMYYFEKRMIIERIEKLLIEEDEDEIS